MTDTIINASFWITSAFLFYTLYRLYTLIFKEEKKKWVCLLTFAAGFACISTLWTLSHNVLVMLGSNLLIYFALTYNFKANFGKRILSSIGAYALFSLAETLVMGLFTLLHLDIRHNDYYKLWGSALTPLLSYVAISAIIQHTEIKKQTTFKNMHMTFLGILVFIIFGIAVVLPYISADNIFHMFIGIVLLIMIAVFLFAFMDSLVMESKERVARASFEMQSKLYSNELNMVKEYQYEIKTIRHNIDHHIQTLNGLLSKEEYERAREYAKGLTKVVNVDLTPIVTSIPELDSILNLKLSQAYQMGIKVNSTIKVEEKCKLSPQSYISIIGNLMDNAIEAVAFLKEPEKKAAGYFGLAL